MIGLLDCSGQGWLQIEELALALVLSSLRTRARSEAKKRWLADQCARRSVCGAFHSRKVWV